jgi:hypothetical protein
MSADEWYGPALAVTMYQPAYREDVVEMMMDALEHKSAMLRRSPEFEGLEPYARGRVIGLFDVLMAQANYLKEVTLALLYKARTGAAPAEWPAWILQLERDVLEH